jgi:hypothetical protein
MTVALDARQRNQYFAAVLGAVRMIAVVSLSFIEAISIASTIPRCVGGG